MSINQGLEMAYNKDLDLFCIAPNSKPAVCKIINYSKYKFEKKKAEKEAKSKQTKPNPEKEIQITSLTSQHDIETKANQAIKLLQKGYKLKLVVFLKGRMIDRIDVARPYIWTTRYMGILEHLMQLRQHLHNANSSIGSQKRAVCSGICCDFFFVQALCAI